MAAELRRVPGVEEEGDEEGTNVRPAAKPKFKTA
jgi:hypothetical protein